jgi:RHS repeat-associated protein
VIEPGSTAPPRRFLRVAVADLDRDSLTVSLRERTLGLARETVKYDLNRNGIYEFSRTLDPSRDSLLRDSGYSLKTENSTLETSAAYSYSATDGRISQISNPLIPNQLFNYSYLPSSNLLSTVSGPIHTVTNTYEPNRDVLDVKQNKVGTSVISSYDYAVNAVGQRTGVATSGMAFPAIPSWAWSYDSLGQVIAADSSVATSDRAYQYDTIGNRQKSADNLLLPVANNYATNALNQYTSRSVGGSPTLNPLFDLDGNMTSGPLPNAPNASSTLVYDAENRLTVIPSSGGSIIYQYDAQSRRIAKIVGSATINSAIISLYDGWNCIAEYERDRELPTALLKTQLWGKDLSGSLQGAGGVGGLLAISNPPYHTPDPSSDASDGSYIPAAIHYPTYDGNGNVIEYLTGSGTTVCHFDYDPFGNQSIDYFSNTILFSHLLTYRFSTKPRDIETGLSYYGYRYYDPLGGRWINRDPIQERGGANLYGFVGNRPPSYIDNTGLRAIGPSMEAALTALETGAARAGTGIAIAGGGVLSGIGFVLAALTGTANAPGIEPQIELDPYPSPEPNSNPTPVTTPKVTKEDCNEKYAKYKAASNKQRDNPIDGVKCCEDAKKIRDLLQEEVDGRKDYIESGCDIIIPNENVNHPNELASKQKALDRAKRKVEELCK